MRWFVPELHAESDMAARTRWYVAIRWLFLLAVIIPGVGTNLISEGLSEQVRRDSVLSLFILATNLAAYYIVRKRSAAGYFRRVAISLIVIDMLTITTLIFVKGGVESRALILYAIPMLIASTLFGRIGSYAAAAFAVAQYNFVILADWAGLVTTINAVNPGLRYDTGYVINTVAFFTSVLIILAILADFTTSLLSTKEAQAKEALRELEEAQEIAGIGSWTWWVESDKAVWSKNMYGLLSVRPGRLKPGLASYLKHVYEPDLSRVRKAIEESVETRNTFSVDHRIITKKGRRWLRAVGKIVSKDGHAGLVLQGTVQDITDQKLSEARLKRRSLELEQLNSLMIDREVKMVQMKSELARLRQKEADDGTRR
jgi:PAS domain-containing protein